MGQKMLVVLRLTVLISSTILALIGILYVLDVFPGEEVRRVVVKIMSIIGILTGLSLVSVLVRGEKKF